MRLPRALLAVLTVLAVPACGGTAPEAPRPALHELARMDALGQLDQVRLRCAVRELGPIVDGIEERMPEMRAAHARVTRGASSNHARSVQDNMRSAQQLERAVAASLALRDGAAYYRSQGNHSRAAQEASIVMGFLNWARGQGNISVWDGMGAFVLSDEQVRALVEYTDMRAAFVDEVRPPDDPDPLRRLERDHPEVAEIHAALLLGLYSDANLNCD